MCILRRSVKKKKRVKFLEGVILKRRVFMLSGLRQVSGDPYVVVTKAVPILNASLSRTCI